MTYLDDPPTQPALPAPEPAEASDGWPTWLRRSAYVVLIVLATGFFVVATKRGQHGESLPANAAAVVARVPGPGQRVLQQAEVGAELKPGYDGRLTVDGVPIPEEQMQGAVDPNSETARLYGVRPNTKEHVVFVPGPGKVLKRLDPGEITITVRFWKIKDGPERSRSISWQIYAS